MHANVIYPLTVIQIPEYSGLVVHGGVRIGRRHSTLGAVRATVDSFVLSRPCLLKMAASLSTLLTDDQDTYADHLIEVDFLVTYPVWEHNRSKTVSRGFNLRGEGQNFEHILNQTIPKSRDDLLAELPTEFLTKFDEHQLRQIANVFYEYVVGYSRYSNSLFKAPAL